MWQLSRQKNLELYETFLVYIQPSRSIRVLLIECEYSVCQASRNRSPPCAAVEKLIGLRHRMGFGSSKINSFIDIQVHQCSHCQFVLFTEIVDGNLKMTLGMIWTIILRFAIQDISVEGIIIILFLNYQLLVPTQAVIYWPVTDLMSHEKNSPTLTPVSLPFPQFWCIYSGIKC